MSKEVERSEESYMIEFTDSQILKLEQAEPDG